MKRINNDQNPKAGRRRTHGNEKADLSNPGLIPFIAVAAWICVGGIIECWGTLWLVPMLLGMLWFVSVIIQDIWDISYIPEYARLFKKDAFPWWVRPKRRG